MPHGGVLPALAKVAASVIAMLAAAACQPLVYPQHPIAQPLRFQDEGSANALSRLGGDLVQDAPGTEIVTVPPGSGGCGSTGTSVIRGAFPEHVLFATASDQTAPAAAMALSQLAERIKQDAPGSELTILGHTDAVGTDGYNMELSRRRALRVLHMLEAGGLASDHLSAVAIGKRQPIATNDTPQGRALNRRVEFLISSCLAANLAAVRARASADPDTNTPVEVMRLDARGLATVDRISLRQPISDQPAAVTSAPARASGPATLRPSTSVARPAPAPHYLPKTLSPDAQQNPLGPAVPF